MSFKNFASVAFFAFFGGSFRYLLTTWLSFKATMFVNLLGCFLLAFITYYIIERSLLADWLCLGLGTGFVGAFTTFSTLMLDFYKFSTMTASLCYLAISLIGGFSCALLGLICAQKLALRGQGR
ncbi:CrcB family protein [Ligilactobacillus sp. Marseille-Q7487]|uniref:fluoride efflux transporter FluC n=1 Tax=Ligilactobacillus sp. Marseille-Q7487 TaxID=3022128 RepID=UPI0015B5FA74|nr:CrcB family protein [Ligilactobacillus sp. Marseille-Q7487]